MAEQLQSIIWATDIEKVEGREVMTKGIQKSTAVAS